MIPVNVSKRCKHFQTTVIYIYIYILSNSDFSEGENNTKIYIAIRFLTETLLTNRDIFPRGKGIALFRHSLHILAKLHALKLEPPSQLCFHAVNIAILVQTSSNRRTSNYWTPFQQAYNMQLSTSFSRKSM